jgi:hypothetical protein
MMTFSSTKDAACKVQTSTATFEVFPAKAPKDTWALLSHPEEELKNKKAVSWPGEYDFEGVTVRAVGQEEGKQVSYACVADNLRAAFVDAPTLEWSDTELEKLGDIDVLAIAADNPKKVTAFVEAVDPRVVLLLETKGGDLAGTAKALGLTSVSPVSEFKAKPGSLPQDSRQVMVLK